MKDHVQGIEPVSYFDATPDNIEIHRRIGKTELEGRYGIDVDRDWKGYKQQGEILKCT